MAACAHTTADRSATIVRSPTFAAPASASLKGSTDSRSTSPDTARTRPPGDSGRRDSLPDRRLWWPGLAPQTVAAKAYHGLDGTGGPSSLGVLLLRGTRPTGCAHDASEPPLNK